MFPIIIPLIIEKREPSLNEIQLIGALKVLYDKHDTFAKTPLENRSERCSQMNGILQALKKLDKDSPDSPLVKSYCNREIERLTQLHLFLLTIPTDEEEKKLLDLQKSLEDQLWSFCDPSEEDQLEYESKLQDLKAKYNELFNLTDYKRQLSTYIYLRYNSIMRHLIVLKSITVRELRRALS